MVQIFVLLALSAPPTGDTTGDAGSADWGKEHIKVRTARALSGCAPHLFSIINSRFR